MATFARTCPHCGAVFTTEEPRRRYCGEPCYISAKNARNYRKHSEARIAKTIRNRKAKQA